MIAGHEVADFGEEATSENGAKTPIDIRPLVNKALVNRPTTRATLLFVNGSAAVGGTELQTLGMARWLRSQGFNIVSLFDCDYGPIVDRYREEGLPYLLRSDVLWPSRVLSDWINAISPMSALLHGLKVNLKWRVWLRVFFPSIRRWGANRGLTNTTRVGVHRIILDWLTFPLLEGYICNSEFVHEYLANRGFSRSRLIYLKNFVEFDPGGRKTTPIFVRRVIGNGSNPVIPAKVPVITYLANIRPVKGHALLAPILQRLKHRRVPFICLLVGALPEDNRLLQLFRRAGLEEDVVFTGARDDVRAILARSDVFVFPSRMESCPNAVLEAMAAKLPIVGSPWGDQASLIGQGEGGFVVDPRDAVQFADKIEFLLEHPEERRRFGERNYKKLQEAFAPVAIQADALRLFTRMSE